MKQTTKLLKLLSDENRLRTLLLVKKKELCVCQLMGIMGVSQPLVSRNLAMLKDEGLLDERRQGKLVFYSMSKSLPKPAASLLAFIEVQLDGDKVLATDLDTLAECEQYQKTAGSCDMKTFLKFMESRRKKK